MNPRLYASLVEYIQEWMDTNCEKDYWIDGYVHEGMAESMAKAAGAVVDAMVDVQAFMKREGHSA